MKPSYSMPRRRRCCERDRRQSSPETSRVIAGAVTHRTTGLPAARLDRAGTVAAGKASCLWAASPRWARACWWPIWLWRWPQAKTAPDSPYRPRAGFWSASSNCPRRSLFRAWRRCADPWEPPPTKTCWWTRAPGGHLLSAPQGLNHFLNAARQAAAEVIVLDPLYSTHDQDENDTRSMAALCQSLLRLRDASKAALIVVHHVRKSIGREEIGSAFRGSSALHAVGDSYLLLTRPSAHLAATVELRFQFRYAAPPEPRLLQLDPQTLCFSAAGLAPARAAAARKKVEQEHVTKALTDLGPQARYNQLRQQVMDQTDCSKRTAQLAIAEACRQGSIVQADGQYRLPL